MPSAPTILAAYEAHLAEQRRRLRYRRYQQQALRAVDRVEPKVRALARLVMADAGVDGGDVREAA